MQQPWRTSNDRPTRHAVIAGTGRAGTSFLVEWLRAAGVPGAPLDELDYHPDAAAGFERSVLEAGDDYLVKDPWLSEYLEDVDAAGIVIDALIVPVRDLREAAVSRIRQEAARRARTGTPVGWSNDGITPGGLLFPLSVQDQERILAVGQARLLAWALERRVPLYLLHHPRLVRDPDHTIDVLWSWLQHFCTRKEALAAFHATVRPPSGTPVSGTGSDDEIRLREELLAVDAERRRLHAENTTIAELLLAATVERERLATELEAARAAVAQPVPLLRRVFRRLR